MTLGQGAIYGASTRQKLNTKSWTEAELVGVNDVLETVFLFWVTSGPSLRGTRRRWLFRLISNASGPSRAFLFGLF
jgi:hypothetical protein